MDLVQPWCGRVVTEFHPSSVSGASSVFGLSPLSKGFHVLVSPRSSITLLTTNLGTMNWRLRVDVVELGRK